MSDGTELWVCGQVTEEYKASGTLWEFQGIFSDRERAIAACRDGNYFIFPARINEELPHESYEATDAYYPLDDDVGMGSFHGFANLIQDGSDETYAKEEG